MPYQTTPAIFPLYLLPSLPFRRRRSSADSSLSSNSSNSASAVSPVTASTSPTSPSSLSGSSTYLRCSRCLADLCHIKSIISKGFNGRHGRAYLVAPPSEPFSSTKFAHNQGNLPNTNVHKTMDRQLVTGLHKVADIACAVCGQTLGWKYVDADDPSQKYKIGKFILETKRTVKGVCWENKDAASINIAGIAKDTVEFDSEDEDECDLLFEGKWTTQDALQIRAQKRFREKYFDDDIV